MNGIAKAVFLTIGAFCILIGGILIVFILLLLEAINTTQAGFAVTIVVLFFWFILGKADVASENNPLS